MKEEILFITHKYPPSIGGMEKQAYELVRGVKEKIPACEIVWHKRLTVPYFIFWGAKRRAKTILKNSTISLIHMNDGLMTLGIQALEKITPAPILCTFHGLDLIFPNHLYQRLLIPRMKKLDTVITVSYATKEECLKRGLPEEKVVVIPNGVDPEMQHIPADPNFKKKLEGRIGISLERKKLVLSVGRPVRRKGVSWFMENVMVHLDENVCYFIVGAAPKGDRVLRAALNLLPKRLAWQISLMYGLGMDRTRQAELLQNEKLLNRVFLLGKLPYDELIQMYKLADLFVMPNIPVSGDMEGFGLTALEASINGTVVVASALEGIKEAVVDGENGFLVDPLNAEAWKNRIEELLDNPERLEALASRFQQFTAHHFGWDRMVFRYRELFKRFVA